MPSITNEDDNDDEELMIFPLTEFDCDLIEDSRENIPDSKTNILSRREYLANERGREFVPPSSFRFINEAEEYTNSDHSTYGRPIPFKLDRHDSGNSCSSPRVNWLNALKLVKNIKDPWDCYNITDRPTEFATRHRYNALRKQWVVDRVEVKIQKEPFDRGAMRECFRVKKLPTFSKNRDWRHAHNYVAKCYIAENVDRDVYLEDVRLQMDAKLWGEEYNRHNPPKKVDVVQVCFLEIEDGLNQRKSYHLEHYIEGEYIKYNSNSGFVDNNARCTPQAFSHFTFERSGHQLIVVDVQGVGDLWTDPQIHSVDLTIYGDGNLGTKGMALFFQSHVCNSICASLGLAQFDLCETERRARLSFTKSVSPCTRIRGVEEMCISASPYQRTNLGSIFLERSRCQSTCSSSIVSEMSEGEEEDSEVEDGDTDMSSGDSNLSPGLKNHVMLTPPVRAPRQRFYSESEDSNHSLNRAEEEEGMRFHIATNDKARPACLKNELDLWNSQPVQPINNSILGMIHHELAKYHEMGRFCEKGESPNLNAALFHERSAADLGVKEAMVTMACIFFDLPRNLLVDLSLKNDNENREKGVRYLQMAANAGDRGAMLYLAQAYEKGFNIGPEMVSYDKAVQWYSSVAEMSMEDQSGEYDGIMDMPTYDIYAKMAHLYSTAGHGLERDLSVASELYIKKKKVPTATLR